MKFQTFNLTVEQIHESLGRFGSISEMQEDKTIPIDEFLRKIGRKQIDFVDKYKNTSYFCASSPVGDVIKMPSQDMKDNNKIAVLVSDNPSVGKGAFGEGNIFLVSESYHFEFEPNYTYKEIGTDKLYYEISKTIRPKIGCHIQLHEIPVGEILEVNVFTDITGIELREYLYDQDGYRYFPTGQEPIYVAKKYDEYLTKFICRPSSKLYITNLKEDSIV
jgi:hypothetical protein